MVFAFYSPDDVDSVCKLLSLQCDNIQDQTMQLAKNIPKITAQKEGDSILSLLFALAAEHTSTISTITTQLQSSTVLSSLQKLRYLGQLFNGIPNSHVRYGVYLGMLKFAHKVDEFELVIPTLESFNSSWVKDWALKSEEKREIYSVISDALLVTDPQQSYDYSILYLQSHPEASQEKVAEIIARTLQSDPIFCFQQLASIPAVKKAGLFFDLLSIFVKGTLVEFKSFVKKNPEFIKKNKLTHETLTKKITILTLAALASTSKTLSYEKVAKTLSVPLDQVESWVIDVIRADLVEAKMDQLEQALTITRCRVYKRVFGTTEWAALARDVDEMKQGLEGMLDVIAKAKAYDVVAGH